MFNSSEEKTIQNTHDGVLSFHQPDIYICFECIVLFLRNMFKFPGHTHFLEVYATSKEVMLFHDNGFVLLRFACGFNWSSTHGSSCDLILDWKVGCVHWLGGYFHKVLGCFRWFFFARSLGDEF
jgi:hypothetical protein